MGNFLNGCRALFCTAARLSIDLFDRPKMRDMHINKAEFAFLSLSLFLPLSISLSHMYGLFLCHADYKCNPIFYDRHRWPDINWSDELIFYVALFVYPTFSRVCAHATNIYCMQSAYYFLLLPLLLKKGDYNTDGLRQVAMVCQQKIQHKCIAMILLRATY